MGLIRKTLAVGSLGVVNGSSKKQRVAKQTMRNTATTNALLQQEQAAQRDAAGAEADYRYATDETYRAYADSRAPVPTPGPDMSGAACAERIRLNEERRERQRPAMMIMWGVMGMIILGFLWMCFGG